MWNKFFRHNPPLALINSIAGQPDKGVTGLRMAILGYLVGVPGDAGPRVRICKLSAASLVLWENYFRGVAISNESFLNGLTQALLELLRMHGTGLEHVLDGTKRRCRTVAVKL